MRVSRWVNKLVFPYIYYTVQLKRKSQADHFLLTIIRHPEFCRYIVKFEVREITDPLNLSFLHGPEIWRHSFNKTSPDFHTIAKITHILLEAKVYQDENQNYGFHLPIASKLQSVTFHGFQLSSLQRQYRDLDLEAAQKLVLPPTVTITSFRLNSINSEPSTWYFARIKRLRFTSSLGAIEEFLPELLSLPKLTHLALLLSVDVIENTNLVLACPQIRRAVVFVHFGPTSTIVPRRIASVPHAVTSTKSSDPSALCANIEVLGAIMDDRLILSDLKELERTYKMSNEEFWDAIDRL